MAQANVYTTATDRVIFTDKVRITTGTSPVTFQVNLVYPDASGNLYSAPASVSANSFGVDMSMLLTCANPVMPGRA